MNYQNQFMLTATVVIITLLLADPILEMTAIALTSWVNLRKRQMARRILSSLKKDGVVKDQSPSQKSL